MGCLFGSLYVAYFSLQVAYLIVYVEDGSAKISQRESRDVGDGSDAAVEQAHGQRSRFLGQACTSRELQHLRFVADWLQ